MVSLMDAPPEHVLARLSEDEGETVSDERRLLEIELLRRTAGDAPAPFRDALCRWAESTETPEIRARAASACVERGNPSAERIEAMIDDADWSVRARVAMALRGRPDDPLATAALRRLEEDPHSTVRRAARARPTAAGLTTPQGTGP